MEGKGKGKTGEEKEGEKRREYLSSLSVLLALITWLRSDSALIALLTHTHK